MADVIFRHHFSELCSLTNVTVMELSNGHYNEMRYINLRFTYLLTYLLWTRLYVVRLMYPQL